ncbi:MAG: phosphotransferase family protein [Dehalococcoidia bacterium]
MEHGLAALLARDMGARTVHVNDIRGIAGGYSRETFGFHAEIEHRDGRHESADLILRRDPPAAASILPTDRGIEHRLLSRLATITDFPLPASVALDATGEFVERPGLVIRRLPGKSDLTSLFGGADSAQLESVATDLCRQLAKLHQVSIPAADPDGELRDPMAKQLDTSSWDAYVRSQIAYMKRMYRETSFDAMPVFFDAYCSLENRLPKPVPLTFVHGDFQPSNYLYADGRISGIIDFELSHIGDPREDLAALYHVQSLQGYDLMGAVKADGGFLQHYSNLSGIEVTQSDLDFFRLFWLSGVQIPPIGAIKRRLDGEHDEFMHVYIIQPIIAGMNPFAAQLGYPAIQVS